MSIWASAAFVRADEAEAARFSNRAVLVWALWFVSTAVLAAIDENVFSLTVAAISLPLMPGWLSVARRLAVLALAVLCWLLGGLSFIIIGPLAVFLCGQPYLALRMAIAVGATILLAGPYLPLVPGGALVQPFASGGYLVAPTVAALLVVAPWLRRNEAVALLLLPFLIFLLLDAGSASGWVGSSELTAPAFRLLLVLGPAVAATFMMRADIALATPPSRCRQAVALLCVGIIAGGATVGLLPRSTASKIVFDESHGSWETVLGNYGPNDFGRAVNYTYTLLYRYAKRIASADAFLKESDPLPDYNAIFVLKMPTERLGEDFADRLEAWVRAGGRLMVVADHTDLYNTAQNLNRFLEPRFGFRIAHDAVFDADGMPNRSPRVPSAALAARIDGIGDLAWQTGTRLSAVGLGTVVVSSFGPSYAEPGDYSRPNRFGPFVPRAELPFASHAAVVVAPAGSGAVAIVLDSTPWSSFSIFREAYTDLFRRLVMVLEHPASIAAAGYGALILGVMAILALLVTNPITVLLAVMALGVAVGSHVSIGLAAFDAPQESRDFDLRVVVGQAGRLEFLRQLVGPGERNYSRIISSTAKYDRLPTARSPGSEVVDLVRSRQWLLIEPDTRQLPEPNALRAHLRQGGSVAVLFAPNQATDIGVRDWLGRLGLQPTRETGLALSEDLQPSGVGGLLGRRGASAERIIRTGTRPLATSQLAEIAGDSLAKIYTTRPTAFPRTAGVLAVGFAADQFADDAIGDVWEGIQAGSLGRLREYQLAALLSGDEPPSPLPESLLPALPLSSVTGLRHYVVLQDGKQAVQGQLPEGESVGSLVPPSAVNALPAYLSDLRARAVTLIRSRCPAGTGTSTECRDRLLGSDMVEWMVAWRPAEDGSIRAIELAHDRRFSNLGATWNVVFAD